MAFIFNDHIETEPSDPIVKFRTPEIILEWMQDAAAARGIGLEELINEALFDAFHHIPPKPGSNNPWGPLNRVEAKTRKLIRMNRYSTRESVERKMKRIEDLQDKFDWHAFHRLRADNLREVEEALIKQLSKRHRTFNREDVAILREELKNRGFDKKRVNIDGIQIQLAPGKLAKEDRRETCDVTNKVVVELGRGRGYMSANKANEDLLAAVKDIEEKTGVVSRLKAQYLEAMKLRGKL